jgi:chromosome segregation ATPase
VDYFAPGLREIGRRIHRQWLSLRARLAARQLEKAETTLGLLGWQQADFDEKTQTEVERLVEFEREQARITNESAAVGRALREQKEVCEVGRKHYETEKSAIEAERQRMLEEDMAAERLLAEKRRIEPSFEQRMPELDRELRDCSRRHSELLSKVGHSTAVKQELLALRERAVAIPNEVADLRMQHLRTVSEIRALEAQTERHRAHRAGIARQEAELTAGFERADAELTARIKALEREHADLEEEFASLEGAKANPYREVGRVLADSGVAPMNQPQALERVRRGRFLVQEREQALQASLEASAAANPVEIRTSLRLWLGLAIGAVLFVIALIVLG